MYGGIPYMVWFILLERTYYFMTGADHFLPPYATSVASNPLTP